MVKIVIVTEEKDRFSAFVKGLESQAECEVDWIALPEDAEAKVAGASLDVMIIDEQVGAVTNLELAHRIVMANPMVNLALVSALSHDDFHEASEGLGVLVQLGKNPDAEAASELMDAVRRVSLVMPT